VINLSGQIVDRSTCGLWSDGDVEVLFAASRVNLDGELLLWAGSLRLCVHLKVRLDRNSVESSWWNALKDRVPDWQCRDLTTERNWIDDGWQTTLNWPSTGTCGVGRFRHTRNIRRGDGRGRSETIASSSW